MSNHEYIPWRPVHGMCSILIFATFVSALAAVTSYRGREHNRHECLPKILIDEQASPIPPGAKNKPQVKKFT